MGKIGKCLLINNIRSAYGEKTIQSALIGVPTRLVKDRKGLLPFAFKNRAGRKTASPRQRDHSY